MKKKTTLLTRPFDSLFVSLYSIMQLVHMHVSSEAASSLTGISCSGGAFCTVDGFLMRFSSS